MLIVDASVATKWVLSEPDSESARAVLAEGTDLRAPVLLLVEVHNTLAKRFNNGDIPFNQFADASHYLRAAVALHPVDTQGVVDAWQISIGANVLPGTPLGARQTPGFSIYDSIYIGLALSLGAPLITADAKQAEIAERYGVAVRRL